MCGRYMMTSPLEALRQLFAVQTGLNLGPRYNMAPMQPIPIVRLGGEDEWQGRGLTVAQWGLVPHWMKELPTGRPMINARAETVAEKPYFRGAFQHHRCLIPANGFYEWQVQGSDRSGRPKQPYLIHLKGAKESDKDALPLFAFAGLCQMWTGPGGDSALESAAILTTAANAAISPLHHRMPVILRAQDYALWLGEEDVPAKEILSRLTPYADADFTFHPVSRHVNSVANDAPDLIEESTPEKGEDGEGQKRLI